MHGTEPPRSDVAEVGLAEALRRVLVAATSAPHVDGAGCLLLDADRTLRYVTASGTPAEVLELAEELCGEGPGHDAFAGGEVQCNDLQADDRWSRLRVLLSASPIRTVISVPIQLEGHPIGSLNGYSGLPRDWDRSDFDILHRTARAIGGRVAEALDGTLDERGDELTARLHDALANDDRLRDATDLVMHGTGLDRATAGLRLRQMAAAFDRPAIEIADQVLARGALPSSTELVGNAMSVREGGRETDRFALTDPLTGVANRTLFIDHLEQALARAERTTHHPAVVFVDLDRFETVNDSLGYEVGDEVLRAVAGRLREVVRAHDTVARLGGDEFAVLCDAPTRIEVAEALADRIAAALALPITLPGTTPGPSPTSTPQIVVRASVGVAAVDGEGELPAAMQLLIEADTAMNAAKASGGGRVRVYSDQVRREGYRREELERALRNGLAGEVRIADDPREGIRLLFQPILALDSGRIVGFEALARGSFAELGEVGAPELIGVAESAGLIEPLGRALLLDACTTAAAWRALPDGRHPTVAVNVSPLQLGGPRFVTMVAEVLERTGLSVDRLHLEVTESPQLAIVGATRDTLRELDARGVGLTLDDFGIGQSSLGNLSATLPITRLKLDRSFVSRLATDRHGSAVAQAVIALGRDLDLETVAEGVETRAQADLLIDLRCEFAQGYFYSAPIEADGIDDMLLRGVLMGDEPPA